MLSGAYTTVSVTVPDAVFPAPSVTFTANVPAVSPAFGVPLTTPAGLSVSPTALSPVPDVTVHVYPLPLPPLALSVAEYAVPTVPFASVVVEIFTGGYATTSDNVPLTPVSPYASVAFTVNVLVPALVGVPEIAPALDSVSPVGSAPLPSAYVSPPAPPVAATLAEYAVPTVPPASVVVENTIAGGAATPIVNVCVELAAGDPESFTVTVNVTLPAAMGVPVIAPVDAFKLNPGGSVPVVTVHVFGATPPADASVTEYAVPTVAPASAPAVVVIPRFTGTFTVTVPTTPVVATDDAVIVTVNAVPTVAGAVYVTDVVDDPDNTPHPAPVHPVPVSVHVTPALFESFATVAVNVTAFPGSTLLLAGPWIVIVFGPDPPHPARPAANETLNNTTTLLRVRTRLIRLPIIYISTGISIYYFGRPKLPSPACGPTSEILPPFPYFA